MTEDDGFITVHVTRKKFAIKHPTGFFVADNTVSPNKFRYCFQAGEAKLFDTFQEAQSYACGNEKVVEI